MKRALVMLVAGTVLSGVVAAVACTGGPIESAQAADHMGIPTEMAAISQ